MKWRRITVILIIYYLRASENSKLTKYEKNTCVPNDFILIEEWETQVDLNAHDNTAHFAAYKKAMTGKIKSSV